MIYKFTIGPAGSRAMVKARTSAKMCMHVHYLYLKYVPVFPAGPISTPIYIYLYRTIRHTLILC